MAEILRPNPVFYLDVTPAVPLDNTEEVFIIQGGDHKKTSVQNLHAPAVEIANQAKTIAQGAVNIVLTIEFSSSSTHLQWRINSGDWNNLIPIADLKAGDVSLQKTSTHIQWRVGTGAWNDLVALDDLRGESPTLQKTSTHIQWRVGTGAWNDLVALSELKGPQGKSAFDLAVEAGFTGNETEFKTQLTASAFDIGSNTVTTLAGLPISKHMIIANVTAATAMSFSATPDPSLQRVEYTILVKNNHATNNFNQPIPTTGVWSPQNPTTVTVPAGKYAMIGIAYVNSLWFAALIYM